MWQLSQYSDWLWSGRKGFDPKQVHGLFSTPPRLKPAMGFTQPCIPTGVGEYSLRGGGKGKVLPVLFFNLAPHYEAYWERRCVGPRILDFGTRWRWVVSFTPRPIYPRERTPGTHWIGVWVGPRAGLDSVVMKKFPAPNGTRNPDHPVRSPAL
jgi:hypothetical protein